MKMKKSVKIITLIIIFIISFTTINTISYAEEWDLKELTTENSYDPSKYESPSEFSEVASKVLGAISVIGAILTVVIIAVMGFEYILGSSQDIAEIQSRFGGMLIGAVLITFATAIVKLVMSLM